MEHNFSVVNPSEFEQSCEQLIIAIGRLKKSIHPLEAQAAPAESTKKTKAKKAEPAPEPVVEPTTQPSVEAHAAFKKTIVAYATTHGKAAALEKLKSMGFSAFAEVPPQSYDAVAAAFEE